MRILILTGGLGNQIFEYAVYLYLKKKYPNDRLEVCYFSDAFSEHNGCLEVTKYFDAQLPSPHFWAKPLLVMTTYLSKLTGIKLREDTSNPIIENENLLFLYAYHNHKKYIPEDRGWLRFKEPLLSERNAKVLNLMETTNSVFIHVRRGDYLSPKYVKRFEGICTLDYYRKAIGIMRDKYKDISFFIFSDDIPWCQENLGEMIAGAMYVDWNTGHDSYLDMYLMAHCKAGILANSTFSYWAARLCQRKEIVYPAQWIHASYGIPDMFEDHWIGI